MTLHVVVRIRLGVLLVQTARTADSTAAAGAKVANSRTARCSRRASRKVSFPG